MGKIKVAVTQPAGPGEGHPAAFAGRGNLTVKFTPDAGTSSVSSSNIRCSLTVGGNALPFLSSGGDSDGISWDIVFQASGNLVGQQYSITNLANVPSGDTLDNTSGTVTQVNTFSEADLRAVKAPAPSTGGGLTSFFQKISRFFLRLFGAKAS